MWTKSQSTEKGLVASFFEYSDKSLTFIEDRKQPRFSSFQEGPYCIALIVGFMFYF